MKEIIKNWRKWVVAWAFLGASTFGQQSNTVYTTIGTNVVTTGILGQKPRAIGQSFHLLMVNPKDVGVATCSGAGGFSGDIHLEGSFDNSVWTVLGPRITRILNPDVSYYTTASGSFPYLRINYASGNTAQCKLDVFYSGNVTGSLTSNTLPATYDVLQYYGSPNPILGVSSQNLLMPAACLAGTRLTIYSITIINNGVAPLSAGTTVYVADPLFPATMIWKATLEGLAQGGTFIMPNGPRPYYQSQGIAGIQWALYADVVGSDSITVNTVTRCE